MTEATGQVPVAVVVPALVTIALVASLWLGLHGYELIWWREERARRRADRARAGSTWSASCSERSNSRGGDEAA